MKGEKMKKSFTILELIFVIVIIGILATIALPKFAQTKDVVDISKVNQELKKVKLGIQNSISNYIISGTYKCPDLEKSTTDNTVFENVVNGGIPINDNGITWKLENKNKYKIIFSNGATVEIEYNSTDFKNGCPFICNSSGELCSKIVEK